MNLIMLTQGQYAKVDDADFVALSAFKWHAYWNKTAKTFYAARTASRSEARKRTRKSPIRMHQQLLGVVDTNIRVDHRDHDGLNNQRANLRTASKQQNGQNKRKVSGTSRFKGVHFYKTRGNWRAEIRAGRIGKGGRSKRICLGYFALEEDAARAYDVAARRLFGEFALCNFAELALGKEE